MNIDIEPASITQIQRGKNGKNVIIDNDVNNVARDIKNIHPDLFLRFNLQGEYFAVLQNRGPNYRPHVVTTSQTCDQRLVAKVRKITSPDYDYGAEMDKHHDAVDRQHEKEFAERMGEVSEKLSWAIRDDLRKARPGPVYIPPDISPTSGKFFVTRYDKKGTK